MGVEIALNTIIDSVEQLDTLVIPCGLKGTIEGAYNQKLLDWIKKIDERTIVYGKCMFRWVDIRGYRFTGRQKSYHQLVQSRANA